MYRLLIVDDEPIIVEGLLDLFQQSDMELEVYQAADGQEALDMAMSLRMDIILTDIQMPEMDGLTLQKKLLRFWPRCRFVFLTGYNDFNYIQTTVRHGAIDFVLKTEGDERIVQAIEKAIQNLDEEVSRESLVSQARNQMLLAKLSFGKQYMMELLGGNETANLVRARKFAELDIPLHPVRPVYMIIGRIDQWRLGIDVSDHALFYFSVDNIVKELFSPFFTSVHVIGEQNRLIWLLQPHNNGLAGVEPLECDQLHPFIMGTLESAQTMCKTYLQLVCSFVVSIAPYEWDQLASKFDRLTLLFERGLGLGKEMLLTDERMFAVGRGRSDPRLRRIRLLDQYLAQKDKAQFDAAFNEMTEAVGDLQLLQTGLSLEIFYELTAIFITRINRLELFPVISERMNISKLLTISEHASWHEAMALFRELADYLFTVIMKENEEETNEVVIKIRDYVARNLGGDLSLNQLTNIVYLTPFYISRLYKASTGQSISEYIVEMRIEHAKKLLSETPLKIHEIGERIGYDSAPYFSRFFKKNCNMTPQEFRDSFNRI
jgi:two-component system response regulator YesN